MPRNRYTLLLVSFCNLTKKSEKFIIIYTLHLLAINDDRSQSVGRDFYFPYTDDPRKTNRPPRLYIYNTRPMKACGILIDEWKLRFWHNSYFFESFWIDSLNGNRHLHVQIARCCRNRKSVWRSAWWELLCWEKQNYKYSVNRLFYNIKLGQLLSYWHLYKNNQFFISIVR